MADGKLSAVLTLFFRMKVDRAFVIISGSESGIPFSCCSLLSVACMATEPEMTCFVGLVPCDASWVFDAGNLIEPRYGHWEGDSPRFRFGLRPTEEEVSVSVDVNM